MDEFKPAFNALFRNGALTKEVDLGMQIEEVKKLDKKFFDGGFRMRFLYYLDTDGTYQAAWEHGSGTQFWLDTDDEDEFKHEDKKHFNNGLRLKYFRADDGHITAIWHPGSGGQFWATGLSFSEFKAKDKKMRKDGFMLMSFCDRAGDYAGLWRAGTNNYSWISTDNREQFDEFVRTNVEKGRLAVSLKGEQFCAVFHEETGRQRWAFGMFEDDFKQRVEELFKEDFHIVDLYVTFGI